MKVLIPIFIGLLVAGCGKKEAPKQQEKTPTTTRVELIPDSILGTYKHKDINTSHEILLTFRINNDVLEYDFPSDTVRIGKWKVINSEAVVTFQTKIRDGSESIGGYYYKVDYYQMEKNGDLMMVANGKKMVKDGRIKRQDLEEEILYNCVKKEPRLAGPILERKIRERILKPKGELTKADLEKVWNLDLGRNELTSVPKGLEKLTQLTLLVLSGNQLTNVKGLEKLTQLNNLLLHENKLTDVKGLGELMQLKALELSLNQLTNVKGLEKLTQLEDLGLSGNQLTDVKGLEKLTQLTRLDLGDNKLTEVPKELEKLTKLKTLFLSRNQLTSVKDLENLTQLEVLYLSDNPALTKAQIDQLQKALPKCKIFHNAK